MAFLWVTSLHVIFVVTWFAGLFYLPRLFVYHAGATDATGRGRFKVMERRLHALTTMGAGAAVIVYHVGCGRLVSRFRDERNEHSSRGYRAFDELPTLFLFATAILAIVKPFRRAPAGRAAGAREILAYLTCAIASLTALRTHSTSLGEPSG